MKRRWLQDWPWETVVTINAGLCKEKQALHQPTSEGYAPAQKLWESACARELTLRETFDICRQCHKLAPFCFYNGNTFAAIGRTLIQDLLRKMPPMKAHGFRALLVTTSQARLAQTNWPKCSTGLIESPPDHSRTGRHDAGKSARGREHQESREPGEEAVEGRTS